MPELHNKNSTHKIISGKDFTTLQCSNISNEKPWTYQGVGVIRSPGAWFVALELTHSSLKRTQNWQWFGAADQQFPVSISSLSTIAEWNQRKELKPQLQIMPNKMVNPARHSLTAADKSKTRTICYWSAYSHHKKSSSPLFFSYGKNVKHLVYCNFLMLPDIHCDTSKIFIQWIKNVLSVSIDYLSHPAAFDVACI